MIRLHVRTTPVNLVYHTLEGGVWDLIRNLDPHYEELLEWLSTYTLNVCRRRMDLEPIACTDTRYTTVAEIVERAREQHRTADFELTDVELLDLLMKLQKSLTHLMVRREWYPAGSDD